MSILVFQVVIYKVHTFIAYIHTGCLVVRGKNTIKHVEAGASEIILNTSTTEMVETSTRMEKRGDLSDSGNGTVVDAKQGGRNI